MGEDWTLPIVLAIGSLAIGLTVAWIARRFAGIEAGSVIAALIFLPVVVVLLFTDRVSEIAAFGVSAKFRAALNAATATNALATPLLSENSSGMRELLYGSDILDRAAAGHDIKDLAFWQQAVHVVAVRPEDWPTPIPFTDAEVRNKLDHMWPLAVVIHYSLLAGSFKGLVVLDDNDRVLGFFEASLFLDLLRIPVDASVPYGGLSKYALSEEGVYAALVQTELWTILLSPKSKASSLGTPSVIYGGVSRLEALKKMARERLEALVLVDQQGRYAGVVDRSDLVIELLLGLASTEDKPPQDNTQ